MNAKRYPSRGKRSTKGKHSTRRGSDSGDTAIEKLSLEIGDTSQEIVLAGVTYEVSAPCAEE